MAYRELDMVEVKEILRLWVRGRGYRAVAEATSVDRKTVRRYVEAGMALGLSRGEGGRDLDDALLADVVAAVQPGGNRPRFRPYLPGASRPMIARPHGRQRCRRHAFVGAGRSGSRRSVSRRRQV